MSPSVSTANSSLPENAGTSVPDTAGQSLRITEIFYSLQGEARTVGLPTVFVRLTGCPLRCLYCDTEYAFSGGELFSIDEDCRQGGRVRAALCDGYRRRAPGPENLPAAADAPVRCRLRGVPGDQWCDELSPVWMRGWSRCST